MELLSQFTSRTVLFLRYNQGEYTFEVAAHGLEKDIGLSRVEITRELNASVFYKRLVSAGERTLWNVAHKCAESGISTTEELSIMCSNGTTLHIIVDADYVDDELGDVKCILSLRKK